jgi:lysophospholipase L1-like esterase
MAETQGSSRTAAIAAVVVVIAALLATPALAGSLQPEPAADPSRSSQCSRPGVLVWDGGSIMRGQVPSNGLDYPSQTTRLLRRTCVSFNSGSSNATLAGMLADAGAEVDARYDGSADANVCIVMGGGADLAAGRDPMDVYDDLAAYCAARRAAGFQVVVVTLLPRDRSGFNAACQDFHALVRTRWAEIADGLADVAADGRVGDPGDNHDLTYYLPDAVHPNDAGNEVMAAVTAPVLESLDWRSDIDPPTTTAAGADGLWHRSAVVVAFTAVDEPEGSGVAATEYRLDEGPWTTGATCVVTAPADHSGDGEHSVAYRSSDAAGNSEPERFLTVRIDTTAPVGSLRLAAGASPSATPDVVVESSVTDANGVAGMRFSVDGRATWGDWLPLAPSLTFCLPEGNGERTVWAHYRDQAGNLLETSDTIWVSRTRPDTAPPTTVVSGVDGRWHRRAVAVTLEATDEAGGSGVSLTESRLDDGPWRAGTACVVAAPADHSGDGAHVLAYRTTDQAGNREAVRRRVVKIDTRGPATIARMAHGIRDQPIALRFRVRDALSPRARGVRVVVRDAHGAVVKRFALAACPMAAWRHAVWTPRATGVYRFTVRARDMAGNAQRRVGGAAVVVL